MKYLKVVALVFLLIGSSYGDLMSKLKNLVGYTIVASKTVVGYIDKDGNRKDAFEGCDYGRKIIFEDETYLTCQEYQYVYSYRPDAIILANRNRYQMVIENETFEMGN